MRRTKKKATAGHKKEAKAISTSTMVVSLSDFSGKDLNEFAESFARFLQMTGQTHASGRVKCDVLLQCCRTKYLEKQVKQIVTKSNIFAEVLLGLERQYPTYETDLSIRNEILHLGTLLNNPKPARITELLGDLDDLVGCLTPGSYSPDDLLFWFVSKLPKNVWEKWRLTPERKRRTLLYEVLSMLLLELALEKKANSHLNAYRPGGQSGGHVKGNQNNHRPGTSQPRNARYMSTLFWCEVVDDNGESVHAHDSEGHDCFLVKGKKQETNTRKKEKMPEHFRCTVTCAFCGSRKHYEDEFNDKKKLCARLKSEVDKDETRIEGKGGKGGRDKG